MDIHEPRLQKKDLPPVLVERECMNGHAYFAKPDTICPECGLRLCRVTGETSILPIKGD